MIDSSKVSSPILVILLSMQWGSAIFLNRRELVFDIVLIDIFHSRCFWNLISYVLIQIVTAVFFFFLIDYDKYHQSIFRFSKDISGECLSFDNSCWTSNRIWTKCKILRLQKIRFFSFFDWWRQVPLMHLRFPKGYFRRVFVIWQFMLDI